MTRETIEINFKEIQDSVCDQLSYTDGAKFHEDLWTRPGGGGGRTRVINGNYIEKGGVNFSSVNGETPKKILETLKLDQARFYATGVSIVLHPKSPLVPIIHMNIRYFEMDNGIWWFGGGIDLTPHFIDKKEAQFFHQQLKKTCDDSNPEFYQKFKKWADDYFFIPHRKETRGIGGIFFDRLNDQSCPLNKTQIFEFIRNIGSTFAPTYLKILDKNKDIKFNERQRNWQYLRRSRYAEFNLVYDKGTKFGLETEGRIESILMSMPPQANWTYDYDKDNTEQETLDLLKKNIDWINIC